MLSKIKQIPIILFAVTIGAISLLAYFLLDKPASVRCIEPPVDLAFPRRMLATFEPTQVPLEGWKSVATTEQEEFRSYIQMEFRNDMELWVLRPVTRYSLETQQIRTYKFFSRDARIRLFAMELARDNTLWIAGEIRLERETNFWLAYYDEVTDQFIRVIDQGEKFLQDSDEYGPPEIKAGINNELWILFSGTLIRYDPKTNLAETILKPEYYYELGSSLTIDHNGSLWLVARAPEETTVYEKGQRFVMRYDHETRNSRWYGSPPGIEHSGVNFSLFVDHLVACGRVIMGGCRSTLLEMAPGIKLSGHQYSFQTARLARGNTGGEDQILSWRPRIVSYGLFLVRG